MIPLRMLFKAKPMPELQIPIRRPKPQLSADPLRVIS